MEKGWKKKKEKRIRKSKNSVKAYVYYFIDHKSVNIRCILLYTTLFLEITGLPMTLKSTKPHVK